MSRKNQSTKKAVKKNTASKNNNSNPKKSNSASRGFSDMRKKGAQRQVSVASAYASGQIGKAPVISMKTRGCRIVHRELIASVTGTVAFTVAQSFALNPGIPQSFPWLSLTAQNWEQYRFNKLKFCYYTRTGSNVPGSMMMAPDYDAADAAPASEQIASSYEDVAEDAPWKDIECNLPSVALNATEKRKFVRTGSLAANLDIKTYDSGNLHLITLDGTAVSWGKLWVEYDVDLYNPQLPPSGNLSTSGSATMVAATSAAPFLNSVILGSLISSAATNVINFQNLFVGGEYQLTYGDNTGADITSMTFGTLVGLTVKTTWGVTATNGSVTSTFIATASTGSITVTCVIATAATMVTMVQIPVSVF